MWYVLHVRSKSEGDVCSALKTFGFPALAPTEHRTIRKGDEWGLRDHTLFPGCVFVYLNYNAENYYKVTALPCVLRFLATEQGTPSPLTYLEAEWIKRLQSPGGGPLEASKVKFLEDGTVEIISGILRHFTGSTIQYDKRSRKAVVETTVCGQPQKVSLSIESVNTVPPEEGSC